MTMKRTKFNIRTIAVTGMLGALATVLMFLEFPIPMLIPPFIKFDFSELPALLAAYAMGPVSGIAVCFIKNVINLLHTQTGGVGELSNFILGVCFVLPAGLIYKRKKTQKSAMIGALAGAVLMSVVSVFKLLCCISSIHKFHANAGNSWSISGDQQECKDIMGCIDLV